MADETAYRGDTWSIALTGLGSLAGYVSIDFTLKTRLSDADSAALVQIRLNATGVDDGLLYLNGVAVDAADADDGSITIDDAGAGDITVALAADQSAQLAPREDLHYDVQLITASGVSTLDVGTLDLVADVSRATS